MAPSLDFAARCDTGSAEAPKSDCMSPQLRCHARSRTIAFVSIGRTVQMWLVLLISQVDVLTSVNLEWEQKLKQALQRSTEEEAMRLQLEHEVGCC